MENSRRRSPVFFRQGYYQTSKALQFGNTQNSRSVGRILGGERFAGRLPTVRGERDSPSATCPRPPRTNGIIRNRERIAFNMKAGSVAVLFKNSFLLRLFEISREARSSYSD